MNIDRQRIDGVKLLESMGNRWDGSRWIAPASASLDLAPEADALHALLMDRAEALAGCTEDSDDEDELRQVADALEAYELKRWPEGKIVGGKG